MITNNNYKGNLVQVLDINISDTIDSEEGVFITLDIDLEHYTTRADFMLVWKQRNYFPYDNSAIDILWLLFSGNFVIRAVTSFTLLTVLLL